MNNNYAVFAWHPYEEMGGFHDMKGMFDTLAEARKFMKEIMDTEYLANYPCTKGTATNLSVGDKYSYGHIVCLTSGLIMLEVEV